MAIPAAVIPGLDREEPDLWIEDDIPTPAADEEEERERAGQADGGRERERPERDGARDNPRP